ncbi:hypothetical protein [Streptomyces sp. NPDC048639]|uniref:hypothetical protein n=1 Tax=Streptomyces sp. NPDC048639 TaxID=3365581 RepID=UPI00372371CB
MATRQTEEQSERRRELSDALDQLRVPDAERPVAVDVRSSTKGHVMGELWGRTYIRPLHGGPEWEAPSEFIRELPEGSEA